jgi:hypothetical protein
MHAEIAPQQAQVEKFALASWSDWRPVHLDKVR